MASFADSVFGRMSRGRQIAIVAVGVAVTAGVFGVSTWATRPTMVPLYADVPVDQVKKMTDKLTELGIVFELDNATGTTILVSSTDLVKARVDMAAEAMPGSGRPGLELFDKPSWGMTDFTQKVNYRRALEGELERSIGKLTNIEAVQVHLALEDDKLFKSSDRPSKASVTLTMTGGVPPKPEMVQGIASMVAGSVGGLDAEHVTIVDARGQSLTMQDDGSLAGLSSRQLAVQREVETYMEQKADRLLSSLVGTGNARVQVSASMNFDKVERTTQAVDPDKQALATEQKSEVSPSSPQQGAGYTQTATSYENSRSVETFSGATGNLKKLTVAVLIADKVTMPPAAAATATAPATPVLPTVTTRSAEELTRIESLVRNALGVDSARGDMISVVSAPFDMPAPEAIVTDSVPAQDLVGRLQSNPKPIIAITALVVLLIVGLVAMSALKPKKVPLTASEQRALAKTPGYAELPASTSSTSLQDAIDAAQERLQPPVEEVKRVIVLPKAPTTPEREQAIATVEQRPDAAIRVTRAWLRT
jgi:flagellar M-ring protein FliF